MILRDITILDWPVYHPHLLRVGSLNSEIGIVTLWTSKDDVAGHISKEKYAVVGQLYSCEAGISGLLRNCLANKKIRHLILIGADLSSSGEALVQLFRKGVDALHNIKGRNEHKIHREIAIEAVDEFRKNVFLHDCRNLKNFSILNSIIDNLPILGSYGEPTIFPEHAIATPKTYPSEEAGFVIRRRYIGDAWLELLWLALRFGTVKRRQQGQIVELLNITIIITYEDPSKIWWRVFYPVSKQDLELQLMNHYPEEDGSVAALLYNGLKQPDSRIIYLDSIAIKSDPDFADSPVTGIHALIDGDEQQKLDFVVHLTFSDFGDEWLSIVYKIRSRQGKIADKLGVKLGILAVNCIGGHLAQNKWEQTRTILSYFKRRHEKIGDPRGNLIISLNDSGIEVLQQDPLGKIIDRFCGRTAKELCEKIFREHRISDISHALDIGSELQKAEIASRKALRYVQDVELQL